MPGPAPRPRSAGRVVVYLLLAGCLFADLGYSQVWHRLAAGLDGLDVASPTASALTQARAASWARAAA